MNHFQRYRERGKRKSVRNKLLRFYSTFRIQRRRTLLNSSSFRDALLHLLYPRAMNESLPVVQLDPGVAADSQIQPSHVVHAGPNLEHMNLEVFDTSPQPNREQMDEEFTTMIYPSVQENLKLPTEGELRLEEPASFNGTLSSLQNLDKDLSFTNQFLAEKSQPDEPEKTNNETEV
ncbi:hypothetical protein Tco_0920561 [Tanacetum coccineum]